MNQQLSVSKRDGRKEPLDLDKIHRVIEWAAEGLNNVSVSQVELKSHIQFYDGIRTKDIHETIIGVKGSWKVVAIGLGLIGAAISALIAKFISWPLARL